MFVKAIMQQILYNLARKQEKTRDYCIKITESKAKVISCLILIVFIARLSDNFHCIIDRTL